MKKFLALGILMVFMVGLFGLVACKRNRSSINDPSDFMLETRAYTAGALVEGKQYYIIPPVNPRPEMAYPIFLVKETLSHPDKGRLIELRLYKPSFVGINSVGVIVYYLEQTFYREADEDNALFTLKLWWDCSYMYGRACWEKEDNSVGRYMTSDEQTIHMWYYRDILSYYRKSPDKFLKWEQ